VGGSEARKEPVSVFLSFFIVFLKSPHRETPKNVIKTKSRKHRFWIFGRFFCKTFSTRSFLQNVFCSVFELPSLRNAQKRTRKKSRMVGGWVWDLANARGGPSTFFWRSLVRRVSCVVAVPCVSAAVIGYRVLRLTRAMEYGVVLLSKDQIRGSSTERTVVPRPRCFPVPRAKPS
jgi:hypothetical protein